MLLAHPPVPEGIPPWQFYLIGSLGTVLLLAIDVFIIVGIWHHLRWAFVLSVVWFLIGLAASLLLMVVDAHIESRRELIGWYELYELAVASYSVVRLINLRRAVKSRDAV